MARVTAEDAWLKAKAMRVVVHDDGFWKKVRRHIGAYNRAIEKGLHPTPYFFEAMAYVDRAKKLQTASLANGGLGAKVPKVGDPLMEAIPIYNTVQRRYAGFSNVLEQLWYGSEAPKFKANQERKFANFGDPRWKDYVANGRRPGVIEWFYICLVHRVTGSGASFEWDHGWRNNRIYQMANIHQPTIDKMATFIANYDKGPIFTSIGNQIPSFNKPTPFDDMPDYWTGGREYLLVIAPQVARQTFEFLAQEVAKTRQPVPIKRAIDEALRIQTRKGWRQFKFVFTAWIMDLAEYLPHLVDPSSDVYHGKNAVEAMEICFEMKNLKRQEIYDRATRLFADLSGTHPMDVEDASPGCDLVRWIENYVPRKGFDHVVENEIFNGSSLVWEKGRQPPPF